MKNKIIIASLLIGSLAYGQIKVQTGVDSSIGNQNPFLDASGYINSDNNIGKGLYFPTTNLKTWEFKTDLVNPGNFSNYFDGMIVYNSGEGEPTTEASVGGIRKNLKRGFYYFKNPGQTFPDGSVAKGEWVRLNDSFAGNEEWKYNPDNERIELVRSGKGEFKNKVYYNEKGGFYNYDSPEFYDGSEVKNIEMNKIPYINFSQRNAKEISFDNTVNGYIYGGKTKNVINIDDNTTNIGEASKSVTNTSFVAQTLPGYSGTLETVSGQGSSAILNGGTVKNLVGSSGSAYVNSGYVKGYTVGSQGVVSVNGEQEGKWNDFMAGWFSSVLGSRENLNVSRAKGMLVETRLGGNRINIKQRLTGLSINSIFNKNASGSIANQYGMVIGLGSQPSALSISNKYGILIGNIVGAESLNYAIYTNKGKVNFGDEVTVHAQDWSDEEKARRKKNVLKIDLPNTDINSADDITSSIVGSRVDFNPNYVGTSIDFGLTNTNTTTNPFMAFSVAPKEGSPSDRDMTIERMRITSEGNVGIGTKSPTEKLEVAGSVKAESFKGANGATVFPDYVFENYYKGASAVKTNYTFKNLNQVERFVKTNGHLPGYQSAKEVKAQGYVDIMKTQLTNVEKIEELYLHTIEQEKEIKAKEAKINALEKDVQELKTLVKQLLNQ